MTTIDDMLRAAKKINTKQLVKTSMRQTSDEYITLQRGQMYSGILSDGTETQRIGVFYTGYAAYTKQLKAAAGQPFDRVTLFDTGSFQQGIYAKANDEGFEVGSTDSKSEMLQQDYTDKIFTLSVGYRMKYAEILLNKIRQNFVISMNNRVRSKQAA